MQLVFEMNDYHLYTLYTTLYRWSKDFYMIFTRF